jgi:hypothetical protein
VLEMALHHGRGARGEGAQLRIVAAVAEPVIRSTVSLCARIC